jgi:hypothetical protein
MSSLTPDTSRQSRDGRPEYTAELLRHFVDLRDGTHGGVTSRRDKEQLFNAAVPLLDPHARQALEEINTYLLLNTGEVTATGVRRSRGDLEAVWALSWPDQQAAGLNPVMIRAYYGAGFQRLRILNLAPARRPRSQDVACARLVRQRRARRGGRQRK